MRVLFTSMPLYSHITPLLPLAGALRRAGHEVAFATGPDATDSLGASADGSGPVVFTAGLPFAETFGRYGRAFPADVLGALSADDRMQHLVYECLIAIAGPALAEDLIPVAREWKPDLVVSEFSEFAGELVAASLNVPHVVHGISTTPAVRAWAPSEQAAIQGAFAGFDVDPKRLGTFEQPFLDIWPHALMPDEGTWLYPDSWPARPEHILPSPVATAIPGADSGSAELPALQGLPYERTVYVTAGTTHNTRPGVLESMIEAVRDAPVNVIATIGSNSDPERFGSQPEHVRIERFIPQNEVLPNCDLVVCTAGAGTVLGALAHGKPLVLLPIASDQHAIANAVEAAGAGLSCNGDLPAATVLRDAFRRVAGEASYTETAQRISREMLSMPAPDELVHRLEKLVFAHKTEA